MKVILTPIGSDGDVLPFVGIGIELIRRGHDVVVIANDHFESMVRHAGLQFAACGTSAQFRQLVSASNILELRRAAREMFGLISRDLHRVVAAQYSSGKTVLVAHLLAAGARIVHELQSAPLATVLLCPAALFSTREPPVYLRAFATNPGGWLNRGAGRLLRTIVEREAGAVINPYRASLGLPPDHLLQPHGNLIGFFPEWFGPRAPDWPMDLTIADFPLYEPHAPDADTVVDEFLREGAAPIVFVPGTGRADVGPVLYAAVDACQRLGRRGILLTRYVDQVPEGLPATVRHFPYVELHRLLPRAVAVVHHGGIGTCARGLASGIPQLILPYGFDQFDNMARLERLGVAASAAWRGITGRLLADKLRWLIETPSVKARAGELAERFRGANGIGVACDAIERLNPSGR